MLLIDEYNTVNRFWIHQSKKKYNDLIKAQFYVLIFSCIICSLKQSSISLFEINTCKGVLSGSMYRLNDINRRILNPNIIFIDLFDVNFFKTYFLENLSSTKISEYRL